METQASGVRPELKRVERLEKGGVIVCHQRTRDRRSRQHASSAIGRSGNFRRLGVPGEDKNKVYNRLHDPRDYAGRRRWSSGRRQRTETAIALCQAELTSRCRTASRNCPPQARQHGAHPGPGARSDGAGQRRATQLGASHHGERRCSCAPASSRIKKAA